MKTVKIFVDGAEAGSMPEDRYIQILNEVRSELKKDVRVRIFIALAGLGGLCKAAYTTIKISALGLFVVAVNTITMQPDLVAELIGEFGKLEPRQIAAAMQNITKIWVLLSVLATAMIMVFSEEDFGYKERYKKNFELLTSLRIREIFKVPADGNLDIVVLEP